MMVLGMKWWAGRKDFSTAFLHLCGVKTVMTVWDCRKLARTRLLSLEKTLLSMPP